MLNLCIFFSLLFLGFQDFQNENFLRDFKIKETKNILTSRKWRDGVNMCSRLLEKNHPERLKIALEIWKKSEIETSKTENGFKSECCKMKFPSEKELSQHALTCGEEKSEDNLGL